MSHLKPYEPNVPNKLFYKVKSMYKVQEERKKAVVVLSEMAKFTTKPDVEVRWKV